MNLLAHAEAKTNRNPSAAQKAAGNYSKGRLRVHGLEISIESPRGSMRRGLGPNGREWSVRMPTAYGYIKRTVGADDSHVDAFVGPHLKSPHVFVIDQHDIHGTKDFDEHKVGIGFGSAKQFREAYRRAFSDGHGKDRIGHVESMTIDQFKDWLRDGDTKNAIRRAEGGGVRWDDAGGDVKWDETPPPVDNGKLDALGRGAAQGATFNFADEIAGARAAAPKIPGTNLDLPDFVGPLPMRTLAGVSRTAVDTIRGEPTPEYDKGRDEFRAADEAAKKAHPYIHGAGELAGAVPSMAVLPGAGAAAARLAPTAGRIAKFGAGATDAAATGATYGGLSGAGEGKDIGERAMESAKGIVSGIVGGAAGSVVGEGVSALGNKYVAPAVQFFRNKKDPEGAAAAALRGAIEADQAMIAKGTAKGMPVQDWVAARAAGEPVTLADLGAGNVQALLRSAANTSPEARAHLEQVFEGRFLSQGNRIGESVRGLVPGGANARKSGDQLVAEYDAGRVPAYKKAYEQGDKPLMSPAMERLMGSDTFVGAMKRAISTGKDRDIEMGLGGFNPMVNVTPDGRIVFNKGAQGAPTYPNLQYWDQVKRELDSVANQAKRSGDTSSSAGALAKILRNELDHQVPAYSAARGIAEQHFGESNALEAGRKLAGKRADPQEVALAMRKMKPDERALFQEGYASDLAERVIGNIRDTRDLTKAIFATPNERKMVATIFGPGGVQHVQNRVALETVMNGARNAMGNSTTARQLIEVGLAGGAMGTYDLYESGGNLMSGLHGVGQGAAMGLAYSHAFKPALAAAAKKITGDVNLATVKNVARLLTSDNPHELRRGMQMLAQNKVLSQRMRTLATNVALSGQAQARQPMSDAVRALQGPITGRADQEQQSP